MKFYHVYIEMQDWYKSEFKRITQDYFQNARNAYLWCYEIAEECGNDCPSYELFKYEMENYGVAQVGQFTIKEMKFKDEETP